VAAPLDEVPCGAATASHALRLGPFIVRAAAWPVETLRGLRSPQLAEEVDRWLDWGEAVARAGVLLSSMLHLVVPRIHDSRRRGLTLALRRHVYRCTTPIPARLLFPVLRSPEMAEDVRTTLRDHAEELTRLAVKRAGLQEVFQAALRAESDELFRLARDPAFLKALYLSSAASFAACERAVAGRAAVPLDLTMTLFGYAMRAIGRATPKGLWAGVALESFEATAQTASLDVPESMPRPSLRSVRFAPSLAPFAAALRAIESARDPSRRDCRFYLNPTVRPFGPDAWRFEVQAPDGSNVGHVATHPWLAQLVTVLRASPVQSASEICAMLALRAPDVPGTAWEGWIRELIPAGILLSALTLPSIYADAWEALRDVIGRLPEEERLTWERTVARLEGICAALAGDPEHLQFSTLRAGVDEARRCIGALLERYGLLPIPLDGPVLHADLRLASRFVIPEPVKARIANAIRSYWQFDRYGSGETEAAIARWRRFGQILEDGELGLPEFVNRQERVNGEGLGCDRPFGESSGEARGAVPDWLDGPWERRLTGIKERSLDAVAASVLRRWYEELHSIHTRPSHSLAPSPSGHRRDPLPPGAALLLIGGASSRSLRLGGVSPDPCLFYARFHHLFQTGADGSPFTRWYREGLWRMETACPGLEFVDLGVRIGANLNAAARPRFARHWVDPLGIDGALPPDSRLRLGPGGRALWVVPFQRRILVPGVNSAVTLEGVDPVSRILCEVGQLVGRPALMRPLPPLEAEVAVWRHLPRLILDDVVVSPERWLPPTSLSQELARTRGLERFITWRRFVRQVGLPGLVYAKYQPHATEALLPADSVLAIERLGRALAAHGGDFQLQEVFPPPDEWWLRDEEGRHYLAELGVSWHGDDEFWHEYWRAGLSDPCTKGRP
jgi:hypothetical protein